MFLVSCESMLVTNINKNTLLNIFINVFTNFIIILLLLFQGIPKVVLVIEGNHHLKRPQI